MVEKSIKFSPVEGRDDTAVAYITLNIFSVYLRPPNLNVIRHIEFFTLISVGNVPSGQREFLQSAFKKQV